MSEIETPQRFGQPLYEGLPDDDYTKEPRDFTVAVAGSQRHEGDKPWAYVVSAHSTELAWAKVLGWHMVTHADVDAFVVAEKSFLGVPVNAGYNWNDLRPEQRRRASMERMIREARTLVAEKAKQLAPFTDDEGDVLDGKYSAYDETRADVHESGWELVEALAQLAEGE